MLRFAMLAVPLVIPSSVHAAEVAPDIKSTVGRSLAFLAKDALAWKEDRRCSSCHHAPMAIWTLNEARKRGYPADEKAVSELMQWIIAKDDPAKVYPKQQPRSETIVNQSPLMLALGFEAGDTKDPAAREGLKKMLSTVLSQQEKDGSWRLLYVWEPFGAKPDAMSSLSLLALTSPTAPNLGKDAKTAIAKGLKWLEAAPIGDNLQSHALRLLLWRRLGRPADQLEPLIKQIRARQAADGGWGQETKRPSDAYATGQALYALAEAGVKPADETVRRAQRFLAKTQRQDGSWAMASRPGGPGGKSAKNLAPIVYAGTAWATLGLMRTAPAGDRAVDDRPATPAEQYKTLLNEYHAARADIAKAKTDVERKKVIERRDRIPPRFLELAEKNPKDPIVVDALFDMVWFGMPGSEKALALLQRDHTRSDRLIQVRTQTAFGLPQDVTILQQLSSFFNKEGETFLRTVLDNNPHRDVQGQACLALARFYLSRANRLALLKERPELTAQYEKYLGKEYLKQLQTLDPAKVRRETEALLARAAEKYGDVKYPVGGTVGAQANNVLFSIRDLAVGRQAPDIDGLDQDGKHFKLSGYRGKVVLLYFWNDL